MTRELDICHEWLSARGVRDPALAATWARYELVARGSPLTQVLDLDSRGFRNGVFGSLLPLAEWIVANWWSLLYEGCPDFSRESTRQVLGLLDRGWLERHSPLFATEGQAYPDIRIFAHGDSNALQWFPDPPSGTNRRIRFLGEGEVVLERTDLAQAFSALVESVLARLKAELETGWEELEEEWLTIRASMADEPALCRQAARLGLDPYDVEGDVLDLLGQAIDSLPEPLLGELASAVSLDTFGRSMNWILESQEVLSRKRNKTRVLDLRQKLMFTPRSTRPWETGYQRARELRTSFDTAEDEPVDPVQFLETGLGLDATRDVVVKVLRQPGFDAVAGVTERGAAGVILTSAVAGATRRFRLSRALYGLVAGPHFDGSVFSLITTAQTPFQAESRAFAAELLLPASLLKREISPQRSVSEDRIDDLARKYSVSRLLVAHQIENHRIALLPMLSGGPDSIL